MAGRMMLEQILRKDNRSSLCICFYIQFAEAAKLGRPASVPEGRVTTKGYADMLKEWVNRNPSTFNKGKCKVLQLGRNKKYRLRGVTQLAGEQLKMTCRSCQTAGQT